MNLTRNEYLSVRWQKLSDLLKRFLSNLANKQNVYYSFVVDASPLFYWQTWGLVNSLIELAKVSAKQIYVHYTPEVDRAFLNELKAIGVVVRAIERFGDGKYCNKIARLQTEEFTKAKCVFFLDTDTIVLGELSAIYSDRVIKGKIVDLANPELSVLQTIFKEAGFADYPDVCPADYDPNPTFKNNFNGGLYVIPGTLVKQLGERWQYWALWLLDNLEILERVNKQAHVDQISFAMACHELSISVENVGRKYNYPLHLPEDKIGYPLMLHYHRNISPTGTLEVAGEQDFEFQQAIADANRLLGSSFNNQIFWSFRYEVFSDLGSGVGSRGENLSYKSSLLQTLGIETSQSILDVGCGDLEVIKNLHLPNYLGVDVSPQAIEVARQKRPDLKFVLFERHNSGRLPSADTVICLEVLIHQSTFKDYRRLIELLVQKTKNKLIVSGYTTSQPHHDINHMVHFHESLLDSLHKTQQFSSIEIVGQHSDVEVILAVKRSVK
jgi:SAM-dependent methyltransferase